MAELLAPAGSMESLKAAIAHGADAVYLGMRQFGARAYSANFDEETLPEAVSYAHLRGVKVYVTMNTIVFEDELPSVYRRLHFLNDVGVDGVIVQDLAVLAYAVAHFEDMEVHCSTQMGIDDVEGAALAKELGAQRVVVAREAGIDQVKAIRAQAGVAVEAFVHGALCVSYSGNCIMSGMTGNRSGNRGRCIGSCRKLYDIVDVTEGAERERMLGRNYVLSTKDLNTIEHVGELAELDSLKIEGRMKEPVYVANVVSRYRMALDGAAAPADREKLNRTFNRTYTEGYLFGEDRGNIANVERPNHHGYRIGTVSGFRKGLCEVTLSSPLRQNDLIRIRHGFEDINLAAAKIYDRQGQLINGADSVCYLKLREKLAVGDAVFKTKDIAYEKELEAQLEGEFRRFPLNVSVYAYPGAPLVVDAEGLGQRCSYESDEVLAEALTQPTAKDAVVKQLARLSGTVFELGDVDYEDGGAFIPAKMLNEARRAVVERLCAQKLAAKPRRVKSASVDRPCVGERLAERPCESGAAEGLARGAVSAAVPEAAAVAEAAALAEAAAVAVPAAAGATLQKPMLCALATTQEQYDVCKACGLETVYFHNVVARNGAVYRPLEGEVLVGGMGGIQRYRGTNPFVTDYSLNAVNAQSCRELHRLGAARVTLSYEVNETQLRDLLDAHQRACGCAPALEMIVYGRAPLLVTKYCPLKQLGQCGACRTHRYEIRDEYGAFPLLSHENCDTTVLNGKVLNLLDEMPRLAALDGLSAFRLNFTLETPDEVRRIVELAQAKLNGTLAQSVFNSQTDTRGYFNKEIL